MDPFKLFHTHFLFFFHRSICTAGVFFGGEEKITRQLDPMHDIFWKQKGLGWNSRLNLLWRWELQSRFQVVWFDEILWNSARFYQSCMYMYLYTYINLYVCVCLFIHSLFIYLVEGRVEKMFRNKSWAEKDRITSSSESVDSDCARWKTGVFI